MTEITHRSVETNGIRMHIAERAPGRSSSCATASPSPGTPGATSSRRWPRPASTPWRRTCAATARPTGRRRSSRTRSCTSSATWSAWWTRSATKSAVIAGHDWGAPVAWHAALLRARPVPRRHRSERAVPAARPVRPTTVMPQTDEAMFYQLYFQDAGRGRGRARARRARARCAGSLYSASGDAPSAASREQRRHGARERRLSRPDADPADPAAWLTEADIDFYAGEFARTGFRGGLNWYRNIDRNWELLAPLAGRGRHRAGALRRRRPRSGGRLPAAWTSSSPNLTKFVPQPAADDHAARLRPLDAAGAGTPR